jgi:hypothetical protein
LWGKSIVARGNSICKGSDIEKCLTSARNKKKASSNRRRLIGHAFREVPWAK